MNINTLLKISRPDRYIVIYSHVRVLWNGKVDDWHKEIFNGAKPFWQEKIERYEYSPHGILMIYINGIQEYDSEGRVWLDREMDRFRWRK